MHQFDNLGCCWWRMVESIGFLLMMHVSRATWSTLADCTDYVELCWQFVVDLGLVRPIPSLPLFAGYRTCGAVPNNFNNRPCK